MPESLEAEVEEFLILVSVGATLEELIEPMQRLQEALKERQQTMNLERIFLDQLYEAAEDSNWIPEWYYMNDWISDAASFLRTGDGVNEQVG